MDKVTTIFKIMNIVIQQRNPLLCFPRQAIVSFLSEHYFLKFLHYVSYSMYSSFLLCFIQIFFEIDFYFRAYQSSICFLLVNISLLYGYDIVYSHSGRNLGCFHLFIENKGAMDDSVQSFVWAYVFFILDKYLVI